MIPAGVSFSPMQQSGPMGYGGQRPSPVNPVQDAIKTLSYSIPKQVGASAAAPQMLLGQNPSALGPQTQSVAVQNWLKAIFGGMPQPGAAPGVPPMPSPNYGAMNAGAASMPASQQPYAQPSAPSAPWSPHTQAELDASNQSWTPGPANPGSYNPTFSVVIDQRQAAVQG